MSVSAFIPRILMPFPKKALLEYMASVKTLVFLEVNFVGQLYHYLRTLVDLPAGTRVFARSGGMNLSVTEVKSRIESVLDRKRRPRGGDRVSSVVETPALPRFQPGDYKSDLKPVWCAGCGDYGVVSALYRAMAELQLEPWNTVVVSGIGCSSRLPGYVEAYGFNSVHGRALPIATGIKVARPELNVVAVGGDGDGLAIGGNHFLHASRRNLDLFYILMDNEIYGLTKGQAAPTTPSGDKTKSTYFGNPEPCRRPVRARDLVRRDLGRAAASRAT